MSITVMLELPDETFQSAARLAQLTERKIAEVLVDAVALAIPTLKAPDEGVIPIQELSNAEILELTQLQLDPHADAALSELLYKQQANQLAEPERIKLLRLMQLYQDGLLRKALALAEAVRRGLIPMLAP